MPDVRLRQRGRSGESHPAGAQIKATRPAPVCDISFIPGLHGPRCTPAQPLELSAKGWRPNKISTPPGTFRLILKQLLFSRRLKTCVSDLFTLYWSKYYFSKQCDVPETFGMLFLLKKKNMVNFSVGIAFCHQNAAHRRPQVQQPGASLGAGGGPSRPSYSRLLPTQHPPAFISPVSRVSHP